MIVGTVGGALSVTSHTAIGQGKVKLRLSALNREVAKLRLSEVAKLRLSALGREVVKLRLSAFGREVV